MRLQGAAGRSRMMRRKEAGRRSRESGRRALRRSPHAMRPPASTCLTRQVLVPFVRCCMRDVVGRLGISPLRWDIRSVQPANTCLGKSHFLGTVKSIII